MNRVSRGVVLLLLAACTACGSSSSGGTPTTAGGGSVAASPAPGSSAPASSAPAAAEPAAVDDNPVDGAAFCAFLTTVAPKLKANGSAVGALAALTIDLSNWIEAHPEQKPRTAEDLDAASASCPQSRTAVLGSLSTASFAEAFGG